MSKTIILQCCNMSRYEFIPNVLRPAIEGVQSNDQYAQVVNFCFTILTDQECIHDHYDEEYELERNDDPLDMLTIIGKFKTGNWIDLLAARAAAIVTEQVGT